MKLNHITPVKIARALQAQNDDTKAHEIALDFLLCINDYTPAEQCGAALALIEAEYEDQQVRKIPGTLGYNLRTLRENFQRIEEAQRAA